MPVNPCQTIGLCRIAKEMIKFTKEKSVSIVKRYGIFIVLLLELLSILLSNNLGKGYISFWYPFLANNTILLLFYYILCNRRYLKLCQRTNIGLRFLIAYFVFNSIIMITEFANIFYYNLVTYTILTCAFISLLLTIYKNKK